MAHKIERGIDRMASTSLSTVWHAAETAQDGRLTQVTAGDPETTLLTMAGIVWPADADNDVASTAPIMTANGTPIDSHVATLSPSGRVLGVVGASYNAVSFRVILTDWLLGLARAGGSPETLGTFDGGRNFFASLLVAPAWRVPGDESDTRPLCNVISNHTGDGGIRCSFATFRVVCANTSAMYAQTHDTSTAKTRDAWLTVKHSGNVSERMADAVAWIIDGRARAESEQAMLERMASKLVSPAAVERFIDRYISVPAGASAQTEGRRLAAREAFRADLSAPDLGAHAMTPRGVTAYGLLQAVTHFEDWTSQTRSVDDTPVGTRRAFRAFLGEREAEKSAARSHILSLIN